MFLENNQKVDKNFGWKFLYLKFVDVFEMTDVNLPAGTF